jgi:hypothetical protein
MDSDRMSGPFINIFCQGSTGISNSRHWRVTWMYCLSRTAARIASMISGRRRSVSWNTSLGFVKSPKIWDFGRSNVAALPVHQTETRVDWLIYNCKMHTAPDWSRRSPILSSAIDELTGKFSVRHEFSSRFDVGHGRPVMLQVEGVLATDYNHLITLIISAKHVSELNKQGSHPCTR